VDHVRDPKHIWLPETGLRIINEPITREYSDSFFARYLSSLGGIGVARIGGVATVRSQIRTRSGITETVGAGRARSSGYRLSLYAPPDRLGVFFPFRFGYFVQDIVISGFREELLVFLALDAETIPAVVTDLCTGAFVDIHELIAYSLRLKSWYVGQGMALNFVYGTDDVQFFSILEVGVNLLEVRQSDVKINERRVLGTSLALLQSGQFGLDVGLKIPEIHLAVRAGVEVEAFRGFDYPKPVEFQASVVFNEEKQAYERERVFVDGASLTTVNWELVAVMLF